MKPFYTIAACTLLALLSTAQAMAQATRNVRFTIDASAPNRKPISPLVYGTNDHYAPAPAKRMGGNRLTSYNWENNASNAGRDWIHHSDDWVPAQWNTPENQYNVPGSAVVAFHNQSLQQGAYSLATLPMAGYVAKDKNGTVAESEAAPSSRWARVVTRKPGGGLSLTPNVNDNDVYVDEEIHFLLNRFGRSNTATGIKGYSLDNEPCIWFDTHSRLFGHTGVTVQYLMDKSYETAELVKEMDPTAEVFGPALWGYTAYQNLQFAPDWEQVRGPYQLFLHYYLAKMKERGEALNKRLLDVLDVHWYPQDHRSYNGASPFDDHNDENSVRGRIEMSRSLWDETYWENTWVQDASNGEIFPVLPKLHEMIDTYYPQTKLGITEYSFGGTSHVSGTVAQADALGAFGTQGVYFATYWGAITGYIKSGFDLFCNYDGKGGKYGDLAVSAQTDNREVSAVYASVNSDSDEFMHAIAINRSFSDTVIATVVFSGARQYRSAKVYAVDRTGPQVRRIDDVRNVANNSFQVKLPPMTVYHLVLSETDLTVYPYITDLNITPAIGYSDGSAQFTVTATITDSDNDMRPPTIDLSGVGGSATTPLVRNGDRYSIVYTVPANTPSGLKSLRITADDAAGHSVEASVSYRVIRDIASTDIWNGDAIRTGEGERFADAGDQTAGTQLVERRATGGNTDPGSLYMRFKHDPNYWSLITWRIDPDPGGARDVSEFGYLEFYIRSNAPAYADIDFSLRDAHHMDFSNTVSLKARGYVSSFSPTQYTKVKIPFTDLFSGSNFDLTKLWQLNFLVNTAQEGFEVWIDDVRVTPYDNPAVQPVLSDVRVAPAAGFADGITEVRVSAVATDPNNDLANVTIDLSPIGGANNQPMQLSNGRYTAIFTVPAAAPPGPRTLNITATDQKGNTVEASGTYNVWSRATSDVIWDGDTKNQGVAEGTSNPASQIVVTPTGGNKGPISFHAHLEPNPEPYAYVTWDFAEFNDARMIDVRQKRYLNFSVKVPNGGGRPDFDLQVYFKDRFGESTNVLHLKRDGYLTSFTGDYQDVRIPIADLLANNADVDPGKLAWMGLLSERLPDAGTDIQLDDIYLSGSPVADVQIEARNATCGNDGRIEVKSVTPASTQYRYSIGGAEQTSPVFEQLRAGSYDVRITGPNNFVYVETVMLTGGQGLQGTTQVDNPTGSVDLTVTGGSGNYSYAWSNNATTEDLANVPTGDYTVTVTDNVTGCKATVTARVDRVAAVNFVVKDANCYPNGIITANVVNGSGTYQYYIDGNPNPGGINNNMFSQLVPGVYRIRVTNNSGFDYAQDVTMGGTVNNLVIAHVIDNHHGHIDLTVSGGSGRYRYTWSNGSTAEDQRGLASGNYSVQVEDRDTKCVIAMNFVIARTGPDVTFTHTNAACNTGGTITVATTGASAAPYQYFINGQPNPAGINQPVFRNLQADMYDVRITGANGFVKEGTVFVDGWLNDMVVTGQTDAAAGAIDITVTGGNGDYTYRWSNNATTQDVTGLPDGTYWVDVTDVLTGCVTRAQFQVRRPARPTISFSVTNAACGANGAIQVNFSASDPAGYSFALNGQTNPAGAHDPVFRNLAPGAYTVRVTGPGNFDDSQTVQVGGSLNNLRIIGTADEDGNINITVSGGSGNYRYLWSDKSTTEDLLQRPPGTYTVTVTDVPSGCTRQFSILVASSRESLWVYPSPAQEGFRVKYVIPEGQEMELTVIDLFGRVMYRQVLTEAQANIYVNAAKLRSGMYFVIVKSGKHKQMKPVVIAK